MWQPLFLRKIPEGMAVVFAHPTIHTKPQIALSILQKSSHSVVTRALFFGKIRKGLPIKFADSLQSPKPNIPFPVFKNRVDRIVAKTLFLGKIRKRPPIEFADTPSGCSYPEIALAVLTECQNLGLGKAIFYVKGFKVLPLP